MPRAETPGRRVRNADDRAHLRASASPRESVLVAAVGHAGRDRIVRAPTGKKACTAHPTLWSVADAAWRNHPTKRASQPTNGPDPRLGDLAPLVGRAGCATPFSRARTLALRRDALASKLRTEHKSSVINFMGLYTNRGFWGRMGSLWVAA